MNTLDQAPEQLQVWIGEIDVKVAELTLQRIAFSRALEALGEPTQAIQLVTASSTATTVTVNKPVVQREPAPKVTKTASKTGALRQQRHRAGVKALAGSNGLPKYDYAEVARVANAGVRAGIRPATALMQRYGVKDAMGQWLIREARKRGHEIGRLGATKPLKPTATTATSVHHPAAGTAFTPDDTLKLLSQEQRGD